MIQSVYNPSTGATSCSSCGQFVQFGYDASKHQPACGDCLEGRTPMKQEIAALRAEVARLRGPLPEDMRVDVPRCRAWLAAFANGDDAPERLAELIDLTVKETLKAVRVKLRGEAAVLENRREHETIITCANIVDAMAGQKRSDP